MAILLSVSAVMLWYRASYPILVQPDERQHISTTTDRDLPVTTDARDALDPSFSDCGQTGTGVKNATLCKATAWRQGGFFAGVKGSFRIRCEIECLGLMVGVPGHLFEVMVIVSFTGLRLRLG